MKKIIILLVMALVCAAGIFAQNLQDNENYKKSVDFARQSEQALAAGNYDLAREHAIKSQEFAALYRKDLEKMGAAAPGPKIATYKVKQNDWLWKIAELDYVYGDRNQWMRIYEANKNKLHDPKNPHLIHPGQVFTIPALAGEARSGER